MQPASQPRTPSWLASYDDDIAASGGMQASISPLLPRGVEAKSVCLGRKPRANACGAMPHSLLVVARLEAWLDTAIHASKLTSAWFDRPGATPDRLIETALGDHLELTSDAVVRQPLVIEEMLVVSSAKGAHLQMEEPAVLCWLAGSTDARPLVLAWVPYIQVFGPGPTKIVRIRCLLLRMPLCS